MRRQLVAFLALFISQWALATHIVGGEVMYRYLGNDKYQITLNLFIDCVNGAAGAIAQDSLANFTVFKASDNSLITSLCKSVPRNKPERITKLNYDCIALPPNACVDKYVYIDTLTLPQIAGGYVIAFQRCCRNHSITNLVNPGTTGATYWTQIQDTLATGVNNSAYFKELPPNFLCTNAPLKFDHSAVDPDGDSLVYELYHPYLGASDSDPRPSFSKVSSPPFVQVSFANGYNFANPIDGSPALAIDPITGLLTLTPSQQGQYVIGILVKEYRNGVLVGITRRDYQFNVLNCQFKVVSTYNANDSACGYKMIFSNNSSGAKTFRWDFGDTLTNNDTSTLQSPQYTYPGAGNYNVKLVACDGNCCDSSISKVTILEPLSIQLGSDTSICTQPFKYVIDAKDTTAKYLWSTGDTTRAITVTRAGEYWVKASRCNDVYDTISIRVQSFSDFTLPNVFSPNGDGYNDYYPLMDNRVDEYEVIIYNRWGEKMFETQTNQLWDGKFHNKDVPPGVYFVQLRYKDCRSSQPKEMRGTVTLFREK